MESAKMALCTNNQEEQLRESGCSNDVENSKVYTKRKALHINVFFDGTANNMFNVRDGAINRALKELDEVSQSLRNFDVSDLDKAKNHLNNASTLISQIHDVSEEAIEDITQVDLYLIRIYKEQKNLKKQNQANSIQEEQNLESLTLGEAEALVNKTSAYLIEIKGKRRSSLSYKNYYSNVALLYLGSQKPDTNVINNVYISGAGTFDLGTDSLVGLGVGRGRSGIYQRVKEAFEEINEIYQQKDSQMIVLNVFGFSRGSFYARYFCAMAKTDISQQNNTRRQTRNITRSGRNLLPVNSEDIMINFVGIYDTVTSEGVKHYNDVEPFQQDMGIIKQDIGEKQNIRKVVHLTAKNEYRYHFPLTSIDTAVKEGVGFECSFPGGHTNIGGANPGNRKEKNRISHFDEGDRNKKRDNIHWTWFRDKGYYLGEPQPIACKKLPGEELEQPIACEDGCGEFQVKRKTRHISNSRRSVISERGEYYDVYAKRTVVSRNYQYIFLEIMKDIILQETNITFDGTSKELLFEAIASIEGNTEESRVLKKFRDYAYNYVMTNYNLQDRVIHDVDFEDNDESILTIEEQRIFYNKYIINTLTGGIVNSGKNIDHFNPKRARILDNAGPNEGVSYL